MIFGVDSHCHLDMLSDLAEVVERAQANKIAKMVTIGTELGDAATLLAIRARFPNIVDVALGVHPDNVQQLKESEVREYFQQASQPGVIAIGEIGLDYRENPDTANRHKQREMFALQLEIAKQYDLPVYIHSRDCADEARAIAREVGISRGVFHCFTGAPEEAKQVLDLGFSLSFSGILTFKKAQKIQDTAQYAPLDRIILETDAPFLSPEPNRGKRNEPANVRHVAVFLAALRKVSISDILQQTTATFFTLFPKATQPPAVLEESTQTDRTWN